MTGIVQIAYGLVTATNLLTGPVQFTNAPSYFVNAPSIIELVEGMEERAAAVDANNGFTFTTTNRARQWVAEVAGAYPSEYPTTTVYQVTSAAPFNVWSFVDSVSGNFADPTDAATYNYMFNPRLLTHTLSRALINDTIYRVDGMAASFIQSYTATSTIAWTASNLWIAAGSTNGAPYIHRGSLPITNLWILYRAETNLWITPAADVTWGGASDTYTGRTYRVNADTGSWYVADLASNVTSTLDVAAKITESLTSGTNTQAENIDWSFVASAVTHAGVSTNVWLAGSNTLPVDAGRYYYVTFPRQPVQLWQFTRCQP